jgi:hypothetical protein
MQFKYCLQRSHKRSPVVFKHSLNNIKKGALYSSNTVLIPPRQKPGSVQKS